MMDWEPSFKHYPHFDKYISAQNIARLVRDPVRVTQNSFYPFLLYSKGWQPFRSKIGGRPKRKERPIRFASRRDAYIFSYYRHLLAPRYEELLQRKGVSATVLAYRKIKDPLGAGKSNIEFANDAFTEVRRIGDCGVVTLDISSFFESLDHEQLRERWCRVLGVSDLPADHAAVFRAITRYAVVDRDAAYERLGLASRRIVNGVSSLVFNKALLSMPRQLCTNQEFRQKICGGDKSLPSLITVNKKPFGIPQGSPISDLLANLYLIDFDSRMNSYCLGRGGLYMRYSDDIMLILPGGAKDACAARDFAMQEIKKHGSELLIKKQKTSVMAYHRVGSDQAFQRIDGLQGKNGLEYLGFRYDGRSIRIRDSTISNLYRKVARAASAESFRIVARYPGKDVPFLMSRFDFSGFMQKYGRVERFDPTGEYKTWTFWTYARRALDRFGELGTPISHQLRNYRKIVRRRVAQELDRRLA